MGLHPLGCAAVSLILSALSLPQGARPQDRQPPVTAPAPVTSPTPPRRALPPAQGISVAAFLERWQAMREMKEMARLSPEPAKLAAEFLEPLQAYKAQLDSDRAAGRPPRACPPRGAKQTLNSDMLLSELDKIPVAQRGMSMRDAIFAWLDRQYPCG